MGFGDPYHKHPLKRIYNIPIICDGEIAICFHCELPITDEVFSYGCTDCNYYTHKLCQDLPVTISHPLHDQHPLIRFEPPSSSTSPNLCNECQNPCVGRFAFHCPTCLLFFHLKCLFTINHEKHDHLLILSDGGFLEWSCQVCGHPGRGLNFGCMTCDFPVHPKCSLIPVRVKHHHYHKLTLRHNFPKECNQVYCDLCEDKDGELDRTLSYYYCKRCDYIAHVHCCITEPREDAALYTSFTHEHPLIRGVSDILCNQCDYVSNICTNEYPSLIKHPSHPEHTLVFVDREGDGAFNCTECQFTMGKCDTVEFVHPLWRHNLVFYCENSLFLCDACGKLGKGSRLGYDSGLGLGFSRIGEFDIHLECFAMPGKLEHESHPHHPLYLRWIQNVSTSQYCSICTKEIDPQHWFYLCQECNYAAHTDCAAHDLLSTLRSSIKNQPDFCAIIEPDKTSFEYQISDRRPQTSPEPEDYFFRPPLLIEYDETKCDLGIETSGDVLCYPICNLLIPTQARYSTMKEWESSQLENFDKNSVTSTNGQTRSQSESSLDEKVIDKLYCSICNLLIFPPTYSCAPCQIYFHKSCAELPHKILFNETTYVLKAPPLPKLLSNCYHCESPIPGFAYYSPMGVKIFDIQCASGAPFVNRTYHNHVLSCVRPLFDFSTCAACKNIIKKGTFMMECDDCALNLHLECSLLPHVIKHPIHHHPLELVADLAELYDEYICDACENDLNPNLWAYRCVDDCGIRATSHVTCVITSEKKCHFRYEDECQNMTESQKLEFRNRIRHKGIGKPIGNL